MSVLTVMKHPPAKAKAARKKGEKPEVLPPGQYWCTKCELPHRATSTIGKKHLQYAEVATEPEPTEPEQTEPEPGEPGEEGEGE